MRLVAHEIAHTLQAGPAGGAAHLATPIRRSSADDLVSSMDKTAEAVLDDVVAGSFYTSNEFEERIRKLSSSERRRLREMMTSQSFMDQEIVDELIKVLDNVIAGHIGGTVGHVESRPCKPGDVEPVSLSEWAGDPVIADLERFEGNGESQGKLGRHTPSKSLLLFQRALIQWGCQSASPGRNPLPQYGADGVHGKEFQRGVRQFQREEKLASDGAAGPATVRAMAVELYGINLRQDVEREQEAAFQQQSGGDVPANSFIEERLLEWCDLDLLPERFCRNLYQRIRDRFGNERRDYDVDPDGDFDGYPPDRYSPPEVEEFRGLHNQYDSWRIYIRTNHPTWRSEFNHIACVEDNLADAMTEIKAAGRRYEERVRNLSDNAEAARHQYRQLVIERSTQLRECLPIIAKWYKQKSGASETVEEIMDRVHGDGSTRWRKEWHAAILGVNRILARLWPPAKSALNGFVAEQRARHPTVDFDGSIGELSYGGSLSGGIKGPPKQYIRFDPEDFDVDGLLDAPPLVKIALYLDPFLRPTYWHRIRGRETKIPELHEFMNRTEAELNKLPGYDGGPTDPFSVFMSANYLPEQERFELINERIFRLRDRLVPDRYTAMHDELSAGGYLDEDGGVTSIRTNLTDAEFHKINLILDRYDD